MVSTVQVRDFWDNNPLCASAIPHPLGSTDYFKFYDPMREKIESVAFSYALHEYKDFRDKSVLDVGCGNGYVLSKYAREGACVFGVDVTPTAVSLCQSRFEYLGLEGAFEVADAEALPFADNSFDCVTSMGVLHHVPNTAKAVAEIYRVLKPGGRVIVMFYHRNSAKYRWKYRIFSLFSGKSVETHVNEFDGVGNPKGTVYSKTELRKLLSYFVGLEMSVGFLEASDIVIRGGRHVPDWLFRPLAQRWGWNLYAKARKPSA